jgi:hypothetical protein
MVDKIVRAACSKPPQSLVQQAGVFQHLGNKFPKAPRAVVQNDQTWGVYINGWRQF